MGSLFSFFLKEPDVISVAKDELNEVLQNLSWSGVVKQSPNGFTFVDVDDRFVTEAVKVLRKHGFDAPPYFGGGLVGAHITVMDEEEVKNVETKDILGTEVAFSITGYNVVKPKGIWGERELFLATVEATVLDDIREKAGLEPKQHPFHITIGTRYK